MTGTKEGAKPRVLLFLNRLVIGGPAIDVISMAGFLQNDFEILIIYGEKESHEVEASYLLSKYPNLQLKKIPTLRRSINPFLNISVFFSVVKIIKSFKPAVVHTHGAVPGVVGRLAAFFCRISVIIHTYHGHFFHSYFNKVFSTAIILIEKTLSRISDVIIATSSRQLNDLVDKYKIAPINKVTVIELGIDDAFLSIADQQVNSPFVSKYDIKEDTIRVGIIARIVKVKNFPLFVDVVAKVLKKTERKVVFFVIGDGYLKADIQKLFSDKGISWSGNESLKEGASVIFTSWVSNIGEALSVLDIVVLTSNNEGTGLSLAESQYVGKPVVATNVGGVPDTVVEGETGFLVSPADADTFAEKLLLLIEDDKLRKEMGIAARVFARNKFSKKNEIHSLKQLYIDQLKKNSN